MRGTVRKVTGLLAVALLAAGVAVAQDNQGGAPRGNPRGDQRGGDQRGGRPDMGQMRQWYMNNIKQQLEASDEEWKVLEPLVEKAMNLNRDLMMGGMMRRGGRGGGPGGEGAPAGDAAQADPNASPMTTAAAALRKVLENKQAPAAEIKAKLTAFKEAREKARQELAKTRDSLRELVTPRQEAQLVLAGVLD